MQQGLAYVLSIMVHSTFSPRAVRFLANTNCGVASEPECKPRIFVDLLGPEVHFPDNAIGHQSWRRPVLPSAASCVRQRGKKNNNVITGKRGLERAEMFCR